MPRFSVESAMEYLKTLLVLLMSAMPLAFIVNCSETTEQIVKSWDVNLVTLWFSGDQKNCTDGDTNIRFGLALMKTGSEEQTDLSWAPPAGASNFQFKAMQPVSPGGSPPFLFVDVPLRETTPTSADLIIEYTPPNVGGDVTLVDSFVASFESGGQQAFSRSFKAGALPKNGGVASIEETGGPNKSADSVWKWQNWFYLHDPSPLSQSDAEALVAYFQSGDFFIGLRFPVDHEADVLKYDLPVTMMPGGDSHIAILDHSLPRDGSELSQAVADLLLEYDPARQEFLENNLPQQDATRWAALRPSQTRIEILDRFPIDASKWELFSTGILDLTNLPNNGLEAVPEFYICHEGQNPPPLPDLFSGKIMASLLGAKVVSYQGKGVTCIGPAPMRLAETWTGVATDPPFFFDAPEFDAVTPPARAELSHAIRITGSSSTSVNLDIQSSMGLEWNLYHGDFEHADLSHPITGALTVNPNEHVWLWVVGDVPANANGAETITLTATSTGDASQSTWTTTNLWIGDWVPPEGGGQWTGWIPVVSHASGAQGSSWRSDLGLLNKGTASVDATITLWAGNGPLAITRSVPPSAQLILEDVVDLLAFSGAAALEIGAPSELVLSSRTYSVVGPGAQCYPEGSLGQSLRGYEAVDGLKAGEGGLIPQLQENSAYRTNVAVINTGQSQASVRVHLIDGTGTELTTYDVDLSPGQWKQDNRPFSARAGQTDMRTGYVRIEVLSGSGIVAYGSVVDNITNDPTTMAMTTSDGTGAAWIPVASHASGAQGSSWRTDLGLLNTGSTSADAVLTLHADQGPVTLTRSVPGGTQLILEDVVDQMGFSGAGALEVTASKSLIVTSRTYSQVGSNADCYPEGTMGQSLDSSPDGSGMGAGQSAVIPQLQENSAYRSNVAVINTGAFPAEVRVHLIDGSGTEVGTYDVSLTSGQWMQRNRPFSSIAGVSDLEAGYAMIEVLSGSGIVGYGSVVDNTTNDPTTMPMIQ